MKIGSDLSNVNVDCDCYDCLEALPVAASRVRQGAGLRCRMRRGWHGGKRLRRHVNWRFRVADPSYASGASQ